MSKQVFITHLTLPQDITTEILLRVDWTSIFACKCVSKEWKKIINTPNFGRLHHQCSQSHPSLVSFCTKKVYCLTSSMSCESDRPSYKLRHIPFLTLPDNEMYSLFVGFSNQTACIADSFYDEILLYDLFTHQSSAVPPMGEEFSERDFEIKCCGFGYDCHTNEHKLVVVGVKNAVSASFVYNVERGCWKSIATGHVCPYRATSRSTAVFFKGALHWVVQADENEENWYLERVIWAVDVHSYRWVQIGLPQLSYGYSEEHLTELEIDGKQCLCFICVESVDGDDEDIGRVWVMKEYGDVESWTLLVRISNVRFDSIITPLVVHQGGDGANFVLLAVQNVPSMQFYWYDSENQKTDGIERLRLEDGSIVPRESVTLSLMINEIRKRKRIQGR